MDVDSEIQRVKEERQKMKKDLAAITSLTFDTDLYSVNKFEGYEQSIAVDEDEDNLGPTEIEFARKMASFTAPKQLLKESLRDGGDDEISGLKQPSKIIDRGDNYKQSKLNSLISPERNDPFLDKTPGTGVRTYADVMREEALKRKEEGEVAKMKKEEEEGRDNKICGETKEDE